MSMFGKIPSAKVCQSDYKHYRCCLIEGHKTAHLDNYGKWWLLDEQGNLIRSRWLPGTRPGYYHPEPSAEEALPNA